MRERAQLFVVSVWDARASRKSFATTPGEALLRNPAALFEPGKGLATKPMSFGEGSGKAFVPTYPNAFEGAGDMPAERRPSRVSDRRCLDNWSKASVRQWRYQHPAGSI